MGIKLSDLPPHLRDKVLAQDGRKPRAKKPSGQGDRAPCPGSCSCGEKFESYGPWEAKHWPTCRGRWIVEILLA